MTRPPGTARGAWLLRCALLVFLLNLPCPSSAFSRLAVMDLRSQEGVTAAEARTLSGLLRTALHETGAFTLINREDLEEIARNYEIELTVCEDDACLLRLGTLVGAQLLVTGDVGRVFEDYVVNLRLVDLVGDTLTNRIITSQVAQGNALSFQGAMTRAAQRLAGQPGSRPGELRSPLEAATRERGPAPLEPRKRRFSARAGFSPLTGMVGLEYRGGDVGIGAGYAWWDHSGVAGGMRYCFKSSGASWFVALGGFYCQWEDPEGYRDVTWGYELVGGRLWPLGRLWDLAAAVGIGHIERTDRRPTEGPPGSQTSDTEKRNNDVPYGEVSLGYRF